MKLSRSKVNCKTHKIPELRFENQSLTSFAGLVLFQQYFAVIFLKAQRQQCFSHQKAGNVYGRATIFLQLIVHLLLGFRELSDSKYYHNDPLVQRVLGLKRLPDVATISRMMKGADTKSVENLRQLMQEMIFNRLTIFNPARITLDFDGSYFETPWKPKSWDERFRFVFIRTRTKKQYKGEVQLDLFIPYEYGYEFKVIVTNKNLTMKKVVAFHDGRGSQEGIFAELKSHCRMGYVPVRSRLGNQTYLVAGLFAHNLTRDLQMATMPKLRPTTEKRVSLWVFEKLSTLRRGLLHRAGRLTRPRGKLTLTIGASHRIKDRLLHYLAALQSTA